MNIIVLLFILLLAKTGWADVGGVVDIDAIDINNVDRNAGIGRQISYVEDAAGELVFAQIVSLGGGNGLAIAVSWSI